MKSRHKRTADHCLICGAWAGAKSLTPLAERVASIVSGLDHEDQLAVWSYVNGLLANNVARVFEDVSPEGLEAIRSLPFVSILVKPAQQGEA